jgi:HK97 family phage prohead protease
MISEAPGLEVRSAENGKTVISGYAAVYNSDSKLLYNPDPKRKGYFVERILPGAFDKVLRSNPDAFGKYNHTRVLGRTTSGTMLLSLDERGLRYTIYPKSTDADVVEGVQRGDVRGSSFAFRTPEDGSGERWGWLPDGTRLREVIDVEVLGDAGPVDNPAYDGTSSYVSKRSMELAAEEPPAEPGQESGQADSTDSAPEGDKNTDGEADSQVNQSESTADEPARDPAKEEGEPKPERSADAVLIDECIAKSAALKSKNLSAQLHAL